jgi:hypothetical protein
MMKKRKLKLLMRLLREYLKPEFWDRNIQATLLFVDEGEYTDSIDTLIESLERDIDPVIYDERQMKRDKINQR